MAAPLVSAAARMLAGRAASRRDKQTEGTEVRIGNVGALLLLMTALAFDGAQFLVVATFTPLAIIGGLFFAAVLSLLITLTAYIFILGSIKLFFRDIPLLGGSQTMMKCGGIFAPMLIETIPFLSVIPAITPGVFAFIVATRLEDGDPQATTMVRHALRRGRERPVTQARQQNQLLAAAETGKREGRGPEAAALQKRENRKESRRTRGRNIGMIRRAVFGARRKQVGENLSPFSRGARPVDGVRKIEKEVYRSEFDELEQYNGTM